MQLAQTFCPPGNPCITGPLPPGRFNNLADIISIGLTFVFPLAGLILFANLIWGGFQYLSSQGEEKAVASAKGRLTTSLLGFILLVISFWVAKLVASVLKLPGPFGP